MNSPQPDATRPPVPLFTRMALLLMAIENCAENGNREWEEKHRESLEALCEQHLPRGSGFDQGTKLRNIDCDTVIVKNNERLTFTTSYHHMDEHGGYDGWTDHIVTVRPSLAFGATVTVSGQNRNGIKEFIAEAFNELATRLVTPA